MPTFTHPTAHRRCRRLTVAVVAALSVVAVVAPGAVAGASSPPGSLDPSFGHGGIEQLADPGPGYVGNAVAVQPDGKIVVVGSNMLSFDVFAMNITRYLPNGSLDGSFGNGGRVDPGIHSQGAIALHVDIESDGRIVVLGGQNDEVDVVRLLPDGELDPSFGTGGVVAPLAGRLGSQLSGGFSLAVAGDGSIYIGTERFSRDELIVVRLRPDGTVDTSYGPPGADGFVEIKPSKTLLVDPVGIGIGPDGKLVVAGRVVDLSVFAIDGTILVRLATDGSFDRSYGFGGVAYSPFDVEQLDLTRDGSALLTGDLLGSSSPFIQRLTPIGRPDLGFGQASIEEVPIDATLDGLVQQPHGAIVAFGSDATGDDVLVHLTPAGRPDPAFGVGGVITTSFGPGSFSGVTAAAVAPGRKVVTLTFSNQGTSFPRFLARYG
jgi:uncharacterized delta-60 repeat protein